MFAFKSLLKLHSFARNLKKLPRPLHHPPSTYLLPDIFCNLILFLDLFIIYSRFSNVHIQLLVYNSPKLLALHYLAVTALEKERQTKQVHSV